MSWNYLSVIYVLCDCSKAQLIIVLGVELFKLKMYGLKQQVYACRMQQWYISVVFAFNLDL